MEASRSAATRHSFAPHPGEVELAIEGPTLRDVFVQAGRALFELMTGAAVPGPLDAPEVIIVQARDPEALLVNFLNELVFLSETRKKVYPEIVVGTLTNRMLRATVRGATPHLLHTAVKAATLHRLQIEQTPAGVHARVVLDV